MENIGNFVIYLIMICAIVGAFAAIRNSEEGLGKEFMEGIHLIGHIFIPVAGIMASIPYLSQLIKFVFAHIYGMIGADPSLAATTFIAVDMGGYQLAESLAASKESWIMAMTIGYMAGATIIFVIPVGLAMLNKKEHKFMALGIMSGIITVPIGVFVTCVILLLGNVRIRDSISSNAEATYQLAFSLIDILINLIPLIIMCLLIALGLRFIPDIMIRIFMVFGKVMDTLIKLVLVFSIVEYFTGWFTQLFGVWGFDPIIADESDQFRALEVAGYIGIMLAGAFPMIYMINKYLSKPLNAIGSKIGMKSEGSTGLLAALTNPLALFRLIPKMTTKDKVICIAFCVCANALLGDHLAFTANFQPTLILPISIGKLVGGAIAILIAYKLSVPKALELEKEKVTATA